MWFLLDYLPLRFQPPVHKPNSTNNCDSLAAARSWRWQPALFFLQRNQRLFRILAFASESDIVSCNWKLNASKRWQESWHFHYFCLSVFAPLKSIELQRFLLRLLPLSCLLCRVGGFFTQKRNRWKFEKLRLVLFLGVMKKMACLLLLRKFIQK